MILVKDIVGEMVDALRDVGSITSISNVGDNYTIATDDLKGLSEGDQVEIGSEAYLIRSIDTGSFVVKSSSPVVGTEWKASAPFYFHGTPIMVNNELKQLRIPGKKYPFVYLFERIEERISDDINSVIRNNATIRLFFMDQANINDWTTAQHYDEVIEPMKRLSRRFMSAARRDKRVVKTQLNDYTEINHVNWGLILKPMKGPEINIFDEHLSGVELRLNLPLNGSIFPCNL